MNSQEIVKIIEAELKRQKIPKTKFYADVGIKSGHMSNWRTGNNDPSIKTLVKISEYLGLDLLGKKEAPHAGDGEGRYESMTVGKDDDDSELEELLQIIRSISPDDRPRAKAILAALAQTSAVPSGPSSKVQESP